MSKRWFKTLFVMSNTGRHAEREFEILEKISLTAKVRPIILDFKDEIIALCDKFADSGQSGGSAPYANYLMVRTIEQLCEQLPITPIFDDDETLWEAREGNVLQNKRCSGLFKDAEGKCYYVNAIKFRDPDGQLLTAASAFSSGIEIKTTQYIKGFPFVPMTFIVDRMQLGGRDVVKFPAQMKAVYQHYKQPMSNIIVTGT